MTSFDRQLSPDEVAHKLLEFATDNRFGLDVEEALEQTGPAYLSSGHRFATVSDLSDCVTRFTQQTMKEAGNGRELSDFEALLQAMGFLDRHYVFGAATGYPAAILAVLDFGEDALPGIIDALKIGIRTHLQSQHTRAFYGRLVCSRPWHERCAVAEACRDRLKEILPKHLLTLPIDRLEYVLSDVVATYAACVGTVTKTVSD